MRVWISVSFQHANEIATITVNSVEGPVFELPKVNEQNTVLEPGSQSKYFSLQSPFRVYPHYFHYLVSYIGSPGKIIAFMLYEKYQ